MYLERVVSKGFCYLYLKEYAVRSHYASNSIIVYRFGRIEKALKNMYIWRNDFGLFPEQLQNLGCTQKDLNEWIRTLETGVHKTGRVFALK
ncbi:hypothetical protein FH966_14795 [Lentibacillus cibarius]|uniref:Uncharacterized protein n=1 Tax=Lentibacillus cibarius TaxID=2583219 RepID=A0A549YA81_9BACI|nr:hypothetical protein [Lentibacillus cibarius]TRM08768.1 hypothetical protein FH966_16460 [Lentibacillus cibarius]TRM08796.1 hypothetical protein FH966_16610 [Lentibacillus cibarius]TRM12870.1 hypothetical protein FH966_14795 [Lentibacillus cibarius]